jgi:Phospholipase_D-nuclease N-terminal
MARFLTIVLLLHVSLIVVALVDCLSASERGIRTLPRGAWIFLILLASPVGALAWFLAGQPAPAARPGTRPRSGRVLRPAGVERRRARRPFGPEDDPAFIASLAATARGNDGE